MQRPVGGHEPPAVEEPRGANHPIGHRQTVMEAEMLDHAREQCVPTPVPCGRGLAPDQRRAVGHGGSPELRHELRDPAQRLPLIGGLETVAHLNRCLADGLQHSSRHGRGHLMPEREAMICLHTRLWRPARQRGATRPMMPETTNTRKYGSTRVAPRNERATAAPASSALQAYRISTALRCEWPISSRRWWRCRLSAVMIPLPERMRRPTANSVSISGRASTSSGIATGISRANWSAACGWVVRPIPVMVAPDSSVPSSIDPESPMKIRAGLKLCGRNPAQAPTTRALMSGAGVSSSITPLAPVRKL